MTSENIELDGLPPANDIWLTSGTLSWQKNIDAIQKHPVLLFVT